GGGPRRSDAASETAGCRRSPAPLEHRPQYRLLGLAAMRRAGQRLVVLELLRPPVEQCRAVVAVLGAHGCPPPRNSVRSLSPSWAPARSGRCVAPRAASVGGGGGWGSSRVRGVLGSLVGVCQDGGWPVRSTTCRWDRSRPRRRASHPSR